MTSYVFLLLLVRRGSGRQSTNNQMKETSFHSPIHCTLLFRRLAPTLFHCCLTHTMIVRNIPPMFPTTILFTILRFCVVGSYFVITTDDRGACRGIVSFRDHPVSLFVIHEQLL